MSTARKPAISEFKNPAIFNACQTVILAKLFEEAQRFRVEPIQSATIAAAGLKKDLCNGEPITEFKDAFLSEDETACAAMFADYKRRLHEAGGCGLTPEEIDSGKCPQLVAECLLIDAERNLLRLVAPIFGLDPQIIVGHKAKQFLDLTLKFVCSLPEFEFPKLPDPNSA